MNEKLIQSWAEKVRSASVSVAFPEACEEKILLAASQAAAIGGIVPVLIGNRSEITKCAETFGIDLSGMKIIDKSEEEQFESHIDRLVEAGTMFPRNALARKLRDPLYYAFALQVIREVECVFAGLTHTTGEVILAGQIMTGLAPGISTVSSVGIMDIPSPQPNENRLLAFGDSAVCMAPTSEELADIAISSCETVNQLMDWEPRCALLSFSTDGSAEHEMVSKVREAVRIANEKRPDLKIDGEFQLDAAIDPTVAAKKVKRESVVAGRANIIIYPDLNAGNIGVKLMQQFTHCDAYGPMLQGLAYPVSDCSRSAPVTELVGNIIMLAVRASKSR